MKTRAAVIEEIKSQGTSREVKNKVYYIHEAKPVVYTFKVYARSKAEALQKFKDHGEVEEIGLDPGVGRHKIMVTEEGAAFDTCAECGETYSPDNVRDYLCHECQKKK